ncbi:MAG: gamma-glutamyl-gamma-aminobutyrate hydrolase family protein [Pseudomonadota bacterium]
MRIGILEAGKVNPALVPAHGGYPEIFRAFLSPALPEAEFLDVDVVSGARPGAPGTADAWLVTGSRHGVYDDLAFIAPLRAFLAEAVAAGVPVVGICFGHQILAEALGGRAEKAAGGWGMGRVRYEVTARPGWMAGAGKSFAGYAFHQDQVTAPPPGATVLARTDHCPFAALAYGDPEAPDAISVQPHPEFTTPYLADLIALRRGDGVAEDVADRAAASLSEPAGEEWQGWIAAYLRAAVARRRAA